jgi:hypothetical protein
MVPTPGYRILMKKVFTAILAIIYLSTSMGATLHFHYCMGKLTGWGLIDHGSNTCSICGMQTSGAKQHGVILKGGCCTDENKLIKNSNDQNTLPSGLKFIKTLPAADVCYSLTSVDPYISSFDIHYPGTNAPPGAKIPIFIVNCSFRI